VGFWTIREDQISPVIPSAQKPETKRKHYLYNLIIKQILKEI
jgi:hypothetical protein